ncbi:MAG TPA: F0F1 ATP synthase subunit epsilon [Terriglobales bacterium]|nr:F0F1 ATP synthase subunit epsilon [Terriglobales bacterium]
MKLTVRVPTEILFTEEVTRIKAEAPNGWFGILPRHVDFVTALVPGVLTFISATEEAEYLAIDQGILVKCGPEVSVSTRAAVRGTNLEKLKHDVARQFEAESEREKKNLAFEAKLEADLVRGLLELEKHV